MSIAQKLSRITDLFRPIATDAEIREELEFHLAMREQDNIAEGMDNESARQNARERFGNFEKSFAECHRVSHGLQSISAHVQFGFMVVFAALAIYLGFSLWQTKTLYEAELKLLREKVGQPHQRASKLKQATRDANVETLLNKAQHNQLIVATFSPDPLSEPWSDWSILSNPSRRISVDSQMISGN